MPLFVSVNNNLNQNVITFSNMNVDEMSKNMIFCEILVYYGKNGDYNSENDVSKTLVICVRHNITLSMTDNTVYRIQMYI